MNRIITSIICIAFAVSAFGSSDSKKTQRLIAKGERAYDNFVYTKAVEYFEKALAIYKELGYISDVSDCYNNLGVVYYDLQQIDKSLEYYLKSIDVERKCIV